jgi:hypothetical protein
VTQVTFSGSDAAGGPDLVVSTPVRDGDRTLGVLMAVTPYRVVYETLQGIEAGDDPRDGFATVVDGDCAVRHHPGITGYDPKVNRCGHGGDLCPFAELVHGGRGGAAADYRDPVDGRTYLVGYAPVKGSARPGGRPWGVLVQTEAGSALRPIDELRRDLRWYEGWVAAVAGLLTAGLWGLMSWSLRREERTSHA